MTQHIVVTIKSPFPYLVDLPGWQCSFCTEREYCPSVAACASYLSHRLLHIQADSPSTKLDHFNLNAVCALISKMLMIMFQQIDWLKTWMFYNFCPCVLVFRGTWRVTSLCMNGCTGMENYYSCRKWPARSLRESPTCTNITSCTG